MKEYNLNELYDIYKKQYFKSSALVKQVAEKILSRAEFETNLYEVKKEIKKKGEHRLSGTQIAQRLARADVYKFSRKQAKNIYADLKELGYGEKKDLPPLPSQMEIRGGAAPEAFWEMVKAQYHDLKEKGSTPKQASRVIAEHYFGGDY